jgi:hypothetical protein
LSVFRPYKYEKGSKDIIFFFISLHHFFSLPGHKMGDRGPFHQEFPENPYSFAPSTANYGPTHNIVDDSDLVYDVDLDAGAAVELDKFRRLKA